MIKRTPLLITTILEYEEQGRQRAHLRVRQQGKLYQDSLHAARRAARAAVEAGEDHPDYHKLKAAAKSAVKTNIREHKRLASAIKSNKIKDISRVLHRDDAESDDHHYEAMARFHGASGTKSGHHIFTRQNAKLQPHYDPHGFVKWAKGAHGETHEINSKVVSGRTQVTGAQDRRMQQRAKKRGGFRKPPKVKQQAVNDILVTRTRREKKKPDRRVTTGTGEVIRNRKLKPEHGAVTPAKIRARMKAGKPVEGPLLTGKQAVTQLLKREALEIFESRAYYDDRRGNYRRRGRRSSDRNRHSLTRGFGHKNPRDRWKPQKLLSFLRNPNSRRSLDRQRHGRRKNPGHRRR